MAENYLYGETTVNALGLLVLVVLAIASILVPRKYAAVPILLLCCFVAPGQRIVLAGLDFSFMRIILMAGWARVLLRGELSNYEWKPIDSVMLAWAVFGLVAYTLLWGGDSAKFIWRVGDTMETYGAYVLFRCVVKDWADLRAFLVASIILVTVVLGFFAFENQTRRNLFAVFGGVPPETMFRQGRLRCQGAFAHPILAGCFYATLMPMYVGLLWTTTMHRVLATVGIIASLGIIFFCASSTPILAVLAAMIGGALIVFRKDLAILRLGSVAALIGLHFAMEGPVWHLISRVSAVGGSTGYHRYRLIDAFINRIPEWFLMGTRSTAHWGWGLFDVTNEYILQAVRGGAATMLLFCWSLVLAFQGLGRRMRLLNDLGPNYIMVWGLGVALFAHCTIFIATSYWGQIRITYAYLLATIAALTPTALEMANSRLSDPVRGNGE